MKNKFNITASADFEAAKTDGDGRRRFSMNAYTGGAIELGGWQNPVVIDLNGMSFSRKPRPILKDHDVHQIVGHSEKFEVVEGVLKVTGIISGVGAAAQEVTGSADNGFPWQASIGAVAKRTVPVPEGKSVIVNGKQFDGPMYVVRASNIYEVSFVPLGADDNTSALVASREGAEEMEVLTMEFEAWAKSKDMDITKMSDGDLKAAKELHAEELAKIEAEKKPVEVVAEKPVEIVPDVKAIEAATESERKRVMEIKGVCKGEYPEIEAAAIESGEAIESVKTKVLEQMRAGRPASTPAVHIKEDKGMEHKVMEAAVCMTAKLPNVEKVYDEKTLQAAHEAGPIGVQEILLNAAEKNGLTGIRSVNKANIERIMKAAFGTKDWTGILSNVANKFLLAGYTYGDESWRRIASIRAVRDFKTVTSYRMNANMVFEEVGAGGELKHGTSGEVSYTNKADTYGKMFAVTRTDIINDDLGAMSQVPTEIGRGAKLAFNKVFWTEFMDNATFFVAGNNNFDEGTDTPLSLAALELANQLFLNQTDPQGNPLGVAPRILLVPNALENTAKTLMASAEIRDTTASAKYPVANPFAGAFDVVRSSYLSSAAISGYSSKAWYLLADPMDVPTIEACFLDGVETPTIDQADADFNTLGIQMRGYFDFGVNKQDFRGGVKMLGEAAGS
jgi:hypothetical protein